MRDVGFGGAPDMSFIEERLFIYVRSSRPCGSKVINFDVMDVKPHLPYHVAFQIHVENMKSMLQTF
jgi:hypothetical protein